MIENERRLLHNLRKFDANQRARPNTNRARYISHLTEKAESGVLSQPEAIREAEAQMAAHRAQAKGELLRGPPAPLPAATSVFDLMASRGHAETEHARTTALHRAYRAAAQKREARRQLMVAMGEQADAGEVGAHGRALKSIARTNVSG